MKRVFDKSFLIENRGCYKERRMNRLIDHIDDSAEISIHQILKSPKVPLVDKYYFVFKNCEIENKEIIKLVIDFLLKTKEHYSNIKYNKNLMDVIDLVLENYDDPEKFSIKVLNKKIDIEKIGLNTIDDEMYIAKGLYHVIDLIDVVNKDEGFVLLLGEAYHAIKAFDFAMVSRQDLLNDLFNNIIEYTK